MGKKVGNHPLRGKTGLPPVINKRVQTGIRLQESSNGMTAGTKGIGKSEQKRVREMVKAKRKFTPQERMRYLDENTNPDKVRIAVPQIVKIRTEPLVQSACIPIVEAQVKGFNKFKTVTIGADVFPFCYMAACYGILFQLDAVNGRICELEKSSRYMSQLFHGLRVTDDDNFGYVWDAPETLFDSAVKPALFPLGVFDPVQWGVDLRSLGTTVNPDGSYPVISVPAALTDELVREFGKPCFIEIMNFNASDKKKLVNVDYAREKYQQSPAAFARYAPVRGYQQPRNLDYPTQVMAMYNRAIIEVELEDWEVWLACLGYGEDDESREGYQYDYMGNALSIGFHRNKLDYANGVPGEHWIKIKLMDLGSAFKNFYAMLLKANDEKFPGTTVGGVYTFNPLSPLGRLEYIDLVNTFLLSMIHKYDWNLGSGNVVTDIGYAHVINSLVNMIATPNWNMMMPCNLAEQARSEYPVVFAGTVTYVCLGALLELDLSDEAGITLDLLSLLDSRITSVAASPYLVPDGWPIIDLLPTSAVLSPVSVAVGDRCNKAFLRWKVLAVDLQQNIFMESFTGEVNPLRNTFTDYTDFRTLFGVVGTSNKIHLSLNDAGWDMSHQLPQLIVSTPAGVRPFSLNSLLSLYRERFFISGSASLNSSYLNMIIGRSLDYVTPTNTSMRTENALDTYEKAVQCEGGGLFSGKFDAFDRLISIGKKIAPGVRKRFGDFVRGSIEGALKDARAHDDEVLEGKKEVKKAPTKRPVPVVRRKSVKLKLPKVEVVSQSKALSVDEEFELWKKARSVVV
jgi:hypothetical protein